MSHDSDAAMVDMCRALATRAHGRQQDKAGRPYILHPEQVARRAALLAGQAGWDPVWIARAAATGWLHDTLEDTSVDVQQLTALQLPQAVITAVIRLTRTRREPPETYYAVIRQDPLALLVKQADLWHNTLPSRMRNLPAADRERLSRKYLHAHDCLGLQAPLHLAKATS